MGAGADRFGSTSLPAAGEGLPQWVDARQRLVADERERVEISRGRHIPAARLLGRHVGGGADDVAGSRQRVGLFTSVDDPRDAEVGELGGGAAGSGPRRDEDVRWFDISVDDALLMRVGQRSRNRDDDLQDLTIREAPRCEKLMEGPPADELGDEVRPVVVDRGLVEGDDRGMHQAGGGARFAFEPAEGDVIPLQ